MSVQIIDIWTEPFAGNLSDQILNYPPSFGSFCVKSIRFFILEKNVQKIVNGFFPQTRKKLLI